MIAGLDVWMSEIRLRAVIRIAEISRQLEKNERARTDLHPTDGKQTKEQQLAQAGISTSTANRYEELSAYTEETHPIFVVASENYLAKAQQNGVVPSFGGLYSKAGF
jgi:hypothetical protein